MTDEQITKYINNYINDRMKENPNWLDFCGDVWLFSLCGYIRVTNQNAGTSDVFDKDWETRFMRIGLEIYHKRYDELYAERDVENEERELGSYDIPEMIAQISKMNQRCPKQRYLEAISKLKEVIQILK